jgi:hypothetical protein
MAAENEQENGLSGALMMKAVAAAAAAGAATFAAQRALSHHRAAQDDEHDDVEDEQAGLPEDEHDQEENEEQQTPDEEQTPARPGRGSSLVSSATSSASHALLPLAENLAESAGKYVAENAPDVVKERVVPAFIDAFERAGA